MKNQILIIDDAEMNRDLLRDILEVDYDVLEAENGKAALDILYREREKISAGFTSLQTGMGLSNMPAESG